MQWSKSLISAWYGRRKWLSLLYPLSWLFYLLVMIRLFWLKSVLRPYRSPLFVTIVGNISLGGTGKTPVVMALSEYLVGQGEQVAVVLRGYKGSLTDFPHQVTTDDPANLVGDEAVLLFKCLNHLGVIIMVDPQRVRAVQYLEAQSSVSMVLCDDGLQHYHLERDIEIAVIDGQRRMGNEWLLPAGPLREPVGRLNQVDWVIAKDLAQGNEVRMTLVPKAFKTIDGETSLGLDAFKGQVVHAVAGIGHPQQFFQTLENLGMTVIEHALEDHACIEMSHVLFDDGYPVIMTCKDRVKCVKFKLDKHYYLEVDANLKDEFYTDFMLRVKHLKQLKQKENHG